MRLDSGCSLLLACQLGVAAEPFLACIDAVLVPISFCRKQQFLRVDGSDCAATLGDQHQGQQQCIHRFTFRTVLRSLPDSGRSRPTGRGRTLTSLQTTGSGRPKRLRCPAALGSIAASGRWPGRSRPTRCGCRLVSIQRKEAAVRVAWAVPIERRKSPLRTPQARRRSKPHPLPVLQGTVSPETIHDRIERHAGAPVRLTTPGSLAFTTDARRPTFEGLPRACARETIAVRSNQSRSARWATD